MVKKKWTKENITEEFKIYKNSGNDIRSSSMQKNNRPLFKGILRNYGNYRSFIEEQGINYNEISSKRASWTKEQILAEFRIYEKEESDLRATLMRQKRNDLYIQIGRHFGGYGSFLTSLGYSLEEVTGTKSWTKELIISELTDRYKQGLSLSIRTMTNDNPPLLSSATKHFGTYRDAVNACGINYNEVCEIVFWDDENIKTEFLKLYDDESVRRVDDIRVRNRGLDHAIRKYKGGYYAYCKELGLDVSKVQAEVYEWKKEDLISILQEIRSNGEKLSIMNVHTRFPSVAKVATKYFGSYAKALESIGESIEDHADDRILTSLKGRDFEKLVRDMFVALEKDYEYHYRGFEGIIPDFYDARNNVIIDAKLSSWSIFNCYTAEKYAPHCGTLKVIYLRGKDLQHNIENLELIDVESYFDELKSIGREDIANGFIELKNSIASIDEAS